MKPTAPAFTALLCLAAAATAAADAEPATTTVCGVAKVEERRCHRAPCPSITGLVVDGTGEQFSIGYAPKGVPGNGAVPGLHHDDHVCLTGRFSDARRNYFNVEKSVSAPKPSAQKPVSK